MELEQTPLRNVFAAVFLFFGLQTDPTQLPQVLPLAAGLAAVTAATKVATGWWAAARAGVGGPGRWRAGVTLIARGEFSIVIAGLASAAAAAGTVELDGQFAPVAGVYLLLLTVGGPLAMRLLDLRTRRTSPEEAPPAGGEQVRAHPCTSTGPQWQSVSR